MPRMGGLDATRTLRSSGCSTTIIALTANATQVDKDRCKAAGMDGFLTKPIRPVKLQSVVEMIRNEEPLNDVGFS